MILFNLEPHISQTLSDIAKIYTPYSIPRPDPQSSRIRGVVIISTMVQILRKTIKYRMWIYFFTAKVQSPVARGVTSAGGHATGSAGILKLVETRRNINRTIKQGPVTIKDVIRFVTQKLQFKSTNLKWSVANNHPTKQCYISTKP